MASVPGTNIGSFQTRVTQLLGNRADILNYFVQETSDAIIEISDNYPFEELRETGPLITLTAGVNTYAPTAFLQPPTLINPIQHQLGKVLSWFLYYSPPGTVGSSGAGYNLTFKDIQDIETLLNTTATVPQFWSWLGNELYLASTPSQDYTTYMRYQFLHPFSSPPVITDTVLLPATWFDIISYSAAERIALDLRMQDVADRFHMKLHGDPKRPKELGLISARTSQTNKNQSRTTRSMRVMRGR